MTRIWLVFSESGRLVDTVEYEASISKGEVQRLEGIRRIGRFHVKEKV